MLDLAWGLEQVPTAKEDSTREPLEIVHFFRAAVKTTVLSWFLNFYQRDASCYRVFVCPSVPSQHSTETAKCRSHKQHNRIPSGLVFWCRKSRE